MKMRDKLILIVIAFLLVGMISWGAYSQKSNVTRPQWEYMLVDYINGEEASRKLNELGAQGWELVAVSDKTFNPGNQTSTELVLKRAR
jgi:hypothetical protein